MHDCSNLCWHQRWWPGRLGGLLQVQGMRPPVPGCRWWRLQSTCRCHARADVMHVPMSCTWRFWGWKPRVGTAGFSSSSWPDPTATFMTCGFPALATTHSGRSSSRSTNSPRRVRSRRRVGTIGVAFVDAEPATTGGVGTTSTSVAVGGGSNGELEDAVEVRGGTLASTTAETAEETASAIIIRMEPMETGRLSAASASCSLVTNSAFRPLVSRPRRCNRLRNSVTGRSAEVSASGSTAATAVRRGGLRRRVAMAKIIQDLSRGEQKSGMAKTAKTNANFIYFCLGKKDTTTTVTAKMNWRVRKFYSKYVYVRAYELRACTRRK